MAEIKFRGGSLNYASPVIPLIMVFILRFQLFICVSPMCFTAGPPLTELLGASGKTP